ncbi:MAG: radical SAM protein [Promethearchaeota archaeon]|nr:MAG: radical SAM protein [Candidatus Lokiarchaeota archaeon]
MPIKNYLICRNEPFGGIILNQKNGNTFRVDSELFNVFLAYFNGKKPQDPGVLFKLKFISKDCNKLIYLHQDQKLIKRDIPIASSPEIVSFSITDYCTKGCDYCYNDSNPTGSFFDVNKLPLVIKELRLNRVLQVTIGGGEPTFHPDLEKILSSFRLAGIVPNLTTNGINIDQKALKFIKKYCGALAFSYDPLYSDIIDENIKLAQNLDIATHIHLILSKKALPKLERDIRPLIDLGIERVTLLLMKPIGRGKSLLSICLTEGSLIQLNQVINRLLELSNQFNFQINFDCSFTPFLLHAGIQFDPVQYDFCPATRFSCSLDHNLMVKPCSMMVNFNGISLEEKSLRRIWNSNTFKEFRKYFKNLKKVCNSCTFSSICYGGCPMFEKCLEMY